MRAPGWFSSLAFLAACGVDAPVGEPGGGANDRRSYAVGVHLGVRLAEIGVPVDPEWIVAGLRAATTGEAGRAALDGEEVRRELDGFAALAAAGARAGGSPAGRRRIHDAEAFLAANRDRAGVVTLPSGVQYRILEAGSGEPPALDARITVDYEARLLDGAVVDASRDRFAPTILRLRRAPAAWREVLPRIGAGGRIEIWVPGETTEGGHAMGLVPPGELVTFTVRVVGIDRPHPAAGASPMGRAPPQRKESSS